MSIHYIRAFRHKVGTLHWKAKSVELEVIIYFPCMSVEVQITFLFLQKTQCGAQRVAHIQPSVEGGAGANRGLPSKVVETQGDFHHRFSA